MNSEKTRPIVSFVAACSNSGKTTLIEKIVKILKARNHRVAVIKHTAAGFDLDKPGKDSWRFQQAGADSVVLVGPGKMALIRKLDGVPSPAEIERAAGEVDIVIQEGSRESAKNKIEVFRSGVSGDRPLCIEDGSYLALVSDKPFPVSIPCFDLNDAEGVANFLEKIFAVE
jgi:molybdopterin-guanine dinucleotide biosynthesis protein B